MTLTTLMSCALEFSMLGVGSPTFQWNPIARDVVQRPAPCGNLSEMIPTDYFSLRQNIG